jgi:hypothetical protein
MGIPHPLAIENLVFWKLVPEADSIGSNVDVVLKEYLQDFSFTCQEIVVGFYLTFVAEEYDISQQCEGKALFSSRPIQMFIDALCFIFVPLVRKETNIDNLFFMEIDKAVPNNPQVVLVLHVLVGEEECEHEVIDHGQLQKLIGNKLIKKNHQLCQIPYRTVMD